MQSIINSFIWCAAGGMLVYIVFFMTNNHNKEKKHVLEEWKRKVLHLENWRDEAKETIRSQTIKSLEQKSSIDQFRQIVRDYEKSMEKIHADYIKTQAEIIAMNRRYADLSPLHRHFYYDGPKKGHRHYNESRA